MARLSHVSLEPRKPFSLCSPVPTRATSAPQPICSSTATQRPPERGRSSLISWWNDYEAGAAARSRDSDAGARWRTHRCRSVWKEGLRRTHSLCRRIWPEHKRLTDAISILRSTKLDCLQPIDDLAREVRRFAPDVLAGYPAVLAEIAAVWPEMRGRTRNPRLIFVSGEVATPALRRRIERGFEAPVVDVYASYEFGLIGWECAVTGDLHLCDDNVVVEVVRDGQSVAVGETGNVVVTGLHAYAAPFMRYDLGDVATRGDETCRCRAPFSTLRDLHGRSMDYCLLPDGRKMHHWEVIPMSFWDMRWHRRYQLVQETHERFVLRVIADGHPPAGDLSALSSAIAQKLGPRAVFRIDLVDDLAFPETGKHRLCRSEIGPPRQSAAE